MRQRVENKCNYLEISDRKALKFDDAWEHHYRVFKSTVDGGKLPNVKNLL